MPKNQHSFHRYLLNGYVRINVRVYYLYMNVSWDYEASMVLVVYWLMIWDWGRYVPYVYNDLHMYVE